MFEEYLKLLKNNNWSEKSLKELTIVTDNIINCFARKHDYQDEKFILSRNALLVGEVQSGKTTNFIALMLKALDQNVYDIVIVISGTKKNLMQQTFDRIKLTLDQLESNNKKPKILDKNDLERRKPWFKNKLNESNSNNKFIFVILKQQQSLDLINDIFKKNSNKKILVIDDESDQATPNVEKTKAKQEEFSRIHKAIVKMQNQNTSVNFLFVTATPFSNLLAKSANDLFPRFAFLTYSPINYCGLKKFHSVSSIAKDNLIIENIHKTPKKENLIEVKQFKKQIEKAFYDFIIGNVIYRIQNNSEIYFQMLINIDRYVGVHEEIYDLVHKYEKNLQNIINNQTTSLNKSMLEKLISLTAQKLRDQGVKLSNDIEEKAILTLINDSDIGLNVTIDKVSGGFDFDDNLLDSADQVIIGSEKLQRGVTFKTLRVVFISKVAKINNADTILQRARWFGYRDEYFKYMRLYMPQNLQELFQNLVNVSSEFRDFVIIHESDFESDGVDLSVIDKIFSIPNVKEVDWRLTRESVNRDLKRIQALNSIKSKRGNVFEAYRQLKPASTINNDMIFESIQKIIKLNEKIGENKEIILYKIPKIGSHKFILFDSKLFASNDFCLIKEIEKIFSLEKNGSFNINVLLKDYQIDKILFSLMDYNRTDNILNPRKRTLLSNNSIPITQGYGNNYVGDINIISEVNKTLGENILEIQIHNIEPFNRKNDTPEQQKYMFCVSVASTGSIKDYDPTVINERR